jgi:HEXXH motif-containing protein
MHLHLTNEEARNPLVAHPERSLYSPWMDTSRSAQGVLHGVFVFRCISAFLARIRRSGALTPETNKYAASRVEDIHQQLAEVDSFALERALTPHGVALVRLWAADPPK